MYDYSPNYLRESQVDGSIKICSNQVFWVLPTLDRPFPREKRYEGIQVNACRYPVVPVLFALGAFAISVNQILVDPVESAWGLGFVLLGVPVYLAWARRGYVRENTR